MWSALRSRTLSSSAIQQWKQRPPWPSVLHRALCSSSVVAGEQQADNDNSRIRSSSSRGRREFLNLEEVQKILSDVKADDVQVIPVPKHYDFADYMVIATGRSDWHVRNIAQALIYKAGP